MQKKYNRIWNKNLLIALMFILAVSSAMASVAQSASDTATGTVTVGNAAPTVTTVQAVDNAYSIVTAFTPDNTAIFGINATVADSNTLADLMNVTFWIYDNSIHSGDFASASPNGYDLVMINWNESNDLWTIDQGSFTDWTLQTPQSPGAGSSLSSYTFTARFDISRSAYADLDWRFSVRAYDDQDATATTSVGSDHEMQKYFAISWSASTFAYGSVTAASNNNTMVANRTITIYSNTQWELLINGSDFTAGGEADEDLENQDMMIWSEGAVENSGNSQFLRNTLTVAQGTWDNQARMTTTETPFSRNVNLWFQETGDLTADIQYSITIWIILQSNV